MRRRRRLDAPLTLSSAPGQTGLGVRFFLIGMKRGRLDMGGAGRGGGFIRIKNNDQRAGFQAVTAKLARAFAAHERRVAKKRVNGLRVGAENIA